MSVGKRDLSDGADTELDPEAHKQNLRMAGRHPWPLSHPITQLKQGHLGPVAQDHIQVAFVYFQGWRLHNLSEQPVPVLIHPHSEDEFPDVQREPPVDPFVPIDSGSVTGQHCKKPGSPIFIPSDQVFIQTDKIPLSLLSSPC